MVASLWPRFWHTLYFKSNVRTTFTDIGGMHNNNLKSIHLSDKQKC